MAEGTKSPLEEEGHLTSRYLIQHVINQKHGAFYAFVPPCPTDFHVQPHILVHVRECANIAIQESAMVFWKYKSSLHARQLVRNYIFGTLTY